MSEQEKSSIILNINGGKLTPEQMSICSSFLTPSDF